jgi:hypothetical protein
MSGRVVDSYEEDIVEKLVSLVCIYPDRYLFQDESVQVALAEVKHGEYPTSQRERAKVIASNYAKKDNAEKRAFLAALQNAESHIKSEQPID